MAHTLSVNIESLPEGEVLGVANNLVAIENGGSAEMSDDAVAQFEAETGMTVEDAFKDDVVVNVSSASSSAKAKKGGES